MTSSASSEKARQLVNELYAAWSLHDSDRVDAIFTDDATYEDVAEGQVHRGKSLQGPSLNDPPPNQRMDLTARHAPQRGMLVHAVRDGLLG